MVHFVASMKTAMNILAVDDEYYALELMKRALEEVAGGATVYLCRDVRSALQTAIENKIDVAFLDIHMPEMNGIELARQLKLINPKVNIVFATGFADENRIVTDNVNILPADTYSFPFAADTEKFRSAVNNQRHHPAAGFINLNIAHKAEPAAV